MKRCALCALAVAWLLADRTGASGQQVLDPDFDPQVATPAYTDRHPTVLIDEAHFNFYTAGGRYKPFADLVTKDGYRVAPNRKKFTPEASKGADVLVIANALGAPRMNQPDATKPAFTPAECDAVRDWVRGGGALLLITDHDPMASASEPLAGRFGVAFGKKATFDTANSEPGYSPATLVFGRHNELLGNHPILQGRDESERIERVVTFVGQSLSVPSGSTPLLELSETAVERPVNGGEGEERSAAGRAQGVALTFGKGRVVVLGEASMLSAQLNGPMQRPMGMNLPGCDNRQLALNVMHWLSGLSAAKSGSLAASTPPVAPKPTVPKTAAAPAPKPAMASATTPAPAPAATASPGRTMSTAEIAAESEASIAVIKGKGSFGTGFLVRPNVLCTNAHVIADEFISTLEVRFPSAPDDKQGPHTADLLYEDAERDLAFLEVKTDLPPLRLAPAYKLRKGEDVTVIGNPGLGGEIVLENAISRGIMSTKTTLKGQDYYQLSVAINPGNSGGPVFDSTGQVIGVASRKSTQQEAMAFCIPTEDLQSAVGKVASQSVAEAAKAQGLHRVTTAVQALGASGAIYCVGIDLRRAAANTPARTAANIRAASQQVDAAINEFNKDVSTMLTAEIDKARTDKSLAPSVRDKFGQLSQVFTKLKTGYRNPPTKLTDDALSQMKARYRQLLLDLCKALKIDAPPEQLMAAFENRSPAQQGVVVIMPSRPPLRERATDRRTIPRSRRPVR